MDKITLTPEQLSELESYIDSRGFHDPVVKAEILDHFACKVEEQLAQKPAMKLGDAMRKAHADFGYLGFYVITANLEKTLKGKYRKIFWYAIKKQFVSFPHLIVIILLAYCAYMSYNWAFTKGYAHFLDQNDVLTAAQVLIIASLLRLALLRKKNKSYYTAIASQVIGWSASLLLGFSIGMSHDSDKSIAVHAVLFTVMMLWYYISYFAQFYVLKEAQKDLEEYKGLAT